MVSSCPVMSEILYFLFFGSVLRGGGGGGGGMTKFEDLVRSTNYADIFGSNKSF